MRTTPRRWARLPLLVGGTVALGLSACGGGSASTTPTTPTVAQPAPPPGEFGRNVVRVTGISAADVAGAALLAAYPPGGARQPSGWILTRDDRWPEAVIAAQFAADPVDAAVLPIKNDYLPTAAADLLLRLKPAGFRQAKGLQALVLGSATKELFGDIQGSGLKLSQLKASSPDRLSAATVPFRGGFAGALTNNVLIVSASARDYALPAAAWSAYSGDTIAFVSRNGIPDATRKLLVQRAKVRLQNPAIYIVGPGSVVSSRVEAQLGAYGPVHRIAGRDAVETSVAFARYHDPATGFGFGLKRAPASFTLVNVHHWADVIGAMTLAARGPQAPVLLTTDANRLPASVLRYVKALKGRAASQAYALGDKSRIDTSVLVDLDRLLEGTAPPAAAGAPGA
jgi:hypothetical protein